MILGIDSSGLTASVAILDEDNDIVTAQYTVNLKKTHSETLLPMIDEIFRLTGMVKKEISTVAVAAGPGSFTGLRIGGAAAKGIASALDIPVAAVPTVDGLAYNCYGFGGYVCPLMDARRQQTYTGIYEFVAESGSMNNVGYSMNAILPQCAIGIEELIQRLNDAGDSDTEVMLLGDGVPVFKEIIDRNLILPHCYAPAHMNRQSAAAIARLGAIYVKRGQTVSAASFAPEYLRQSQAEREALEK